MIGGQHSYDRILERLGAGTIFDIGETDNGRVFLAPGIDPGLMRWIERDVAVMRERVRAD